MARSMKKRARIAMARGIRKGKARGLRSPLRMKGLGGEVRMPGIRRGRRSFAMEMNK